MKKVYTLLLSVFIALGITTCCSADDLEQGFRNPPPDDVAGTKRMSCYWWWLNGCVTQEAITKDITAMKEQGYGSALLFDGDGSSQDGNIGVPAGPMFGSPEWKELFRFAVQEADRVGLKLHLMIMSGWNLGGPNITPEYAAKKITHSLTVVNVTENSQTVKLPQPPTTLGYYKDIAVLAFPQTPSGAPQGKRVSLNHFAIKIATSEFGGSAPDCRPLYRDEPDLPGDPDFHINNVVDLTGKMDKDGTLKELPPAEDGKNWLVLRIGYTLTGAKVSTSSGNFQGLVLDHLKTEAFDFYWNDTVKPLLDAVKPFCGKTLQYLETDSWEAGGMNWTETFREEFTKRRGYDPLRYLPIVCGYIGKSRNDSNQFLADFRRTIGDLIADNHYKRFKERAAEYGLGMIPESGGPHGAPIDSLQLLGMSDIPMSEFWSWSPRHRVGDASRFFVKQPASVAHTNGKRFVAAEGLTNIGMYWQESFAENLKPSFDQAVCEGMNLLVWHTMTCSPVEAGLPGNNYFAGTYFNPQCTVWKKAKAFIDYVNRVGFMMQQGLPVADVLEFYGSGVPNFTQGEWANTAKSLPDYDYDVCSEDVLLNQMERVENGVIYLKDGMNYKILVLPDDKNISTAARKKIDELIQQGVTTVKRSDAKTSREVLREKGIKPDVEWKAVSGSAKPARIEWIHRKTKEADIYFLANLTNKPETIKAVFREMKGRTPELWDAVTGQICEAEEWVTGTELQLSLPSCGSTFVVFRKVQTNTLQKNIRQPMHRVEITSGWTVEFQPPFAEEKPFTVKMRQLNDWSKSEDDRIKYFSGTAVYKTELSLDVLNPKHSRILLQFGRVGEFAEVKVNGKSCGTVWAHPYQVDITDSVGDNQTLTIEMETANRWVNRLVGDAKLPADKRLTKTNITHVTEKTPLMPSGIVGPVTLLLEQAD